jgi:PAP2 superfamily
VINVERDPHAFFEPDLQRRVMETGGMLAHAADWTYWLSQLAVVVLALLWIYLRHNHAYLRFRNTLMVTNAIGLVGSLPPLAGLGLLLADRDLQPLLARHRGRIRVRGRRGRDRPLARTHRLAGGQRFAPGATSPAS